MCTISLLSVRRLSLVCFSMFCILLMVRIIIAVAFIRLKLLCEVALLYS